MAELSALFASAFLAATLFPTASEAVLAGLLMAGEQDPLVLLAVASVGNTAGSVVNWLLGRFCAHWRDHRWFPISQRTLERATTWFDRYGKWSLLFAWVPLIGDPLTVVAGVLRVDFRLFLLLVALGKTARYAVIIGLLDPFLA